MDLPAWWEPLASRALAARRSDFTRWPTPPIGGQHDLRTHSAPPPISGVHPGRAALLRGGVHLVVCAAFLFLAANP